MEGKLIDKENKHCTQYVERWRCTNCGHLYTRTVAKGLSHLYINPKSCPRCKYPDLGLKLDQEIVNPTRRDSK